ncbi:MAG: putative Polysaccharide biosynthesis protein CapD, partial [Herminiimonas sp.]|nr:putative Polysaccharide biosynthesis protein CapD [Herminiimonas sp.]
MKSFLDLSRIQKQIIAATADALFLPLAFIFAIWLRYDVIDAQLFHHYIWLIFSAPIISIPIFIRLGLYRAVIRFIDQKILYVIVVGVTLSLVGMAALATLTHTITLSRAVFVIYWVSAILYVVASRFLARGYLLHTSGPDSAVRVAIYGAGAAGTQLATALSAGQEYLPVAFIDDTKELQRATIAGIKIYSSDDLTELVAKKRIKEILLAMPSLTKAQQKRILDRLEPLKVRIKVTPPIKNLISGVLRVQDVREIEI